MTYYFVLYLHCLFIKILFSDFKKIPLTYPNFLVGSCCTFCGVLSVLYFLCCTSVLDFLCCVFCVVYFVLYEIIFLQLLLFRFFENWCFYYPDICASLSRFLFLFSAFLKLFLFIRTFRFACCIKFLFVRSFLFLRLQLK